MSSTVLDKAARIRLVLIRMFLEYGRGELCSPAGDRRSPLRIHIYFGRELVFSADLCYNGTNKKPPLCKGRWQPKADGGIVKKPKIAGNNPSVANATAPFTQGSLWMRSFIFRGMGFALCLCNTKAKLAIKQNDK